jgi:hypothetical protein
MNLNKLFLRWIAIFGMVMVFAISGWGAGDGLTGKYYNNTTFSGAPTKTVIDTTINTDWVYGSPSSINVNDFSIVWSGYIYVPENADYTFSMAHDDYMKLTIDGTQRYENNNWTGGSNNYNDTSAITLTKGYHSIEIKFIEYSGGAYARFAWKNNASITSRTIVPQNNLYTTNQPTFSISDVWMSEGNSGVKDMNFTVILSHDINATVDFNTSAFTASAETATAENDFNTTSGTLTFVAGGSLSKTISVPIIGDMTTELDEDFMIAITNATGGATISRSVAIGTIINDDTWCESHGLDTGFHVIDPDGGDQNNSFEIFCSADNPKKVLVALPNKNSSNNFIFNSDVLGSTNYYSQASTNATHFNAIEINPISMQVITPSTAVLTPVNSSDGTYKILGKGFSNINLLGTPFAIDWSNTYLSGCDTTKLTRKGYHGQAVKINALDYNNKARCEIDSMKLKLLDDYTYLKYEGSEVLEKTCKEMAEAVPTDVLDSSTVKGHYWISPNNNSRTHSRTTITALDRPMVAYCWYQTDLDYVWTFFLAMDGKVTRSKNDLVNKADTCSEKGLWPFVPNSEDTFERVRTFLYDNKPEWDKYTGTNQEKYGSLVGGTYYLGTEHNGVIWPYGSFGVYFPYDGNNDVNGTYKKWGGSSTNKTGWMSGSPMHNIQNLKDGEIDYARKNNDSGVATRDYYSWGNYSNTDVIATPTNTYTYEDTMGAKGWKSVLQDLNKTNDWFISRTGAGQNFDSTGNYPYYEPNGNYYANAWLNFLYDDEGHVRHNDDLDDKYPYYDYMCMAEDNYDFTIRYGLVKGPFNVVESGVSLSGTQYKDANLTTKIVNKPMQFDVVLLENDLSNIRSDYDISAGIFLNDTVMDGATEIARNIWYFGQISDFNQTRFEISADRWPSGVQTWPKASKRLFFEFKYCANDDLNWTDCWTPSGNTATCKTGFTNLCRTANSNDFATRPNSFNFSLTSGGSLNLLKSGEEYNLSVHAYQFGSPNTDTPEYNQSMSKLTISLSKRMPNDDINATLNGTASFPKPFNFLNGLSDANASIAYDDVGRIKVNISDSDWAAIDLPDTPSADRLITGEGNFTFIPFQFTASNIKIVDARDGAFTYLSNDLNMSAKLDFNVTSQNKDGNATKNFSAGLYEFPINVIPNIVDSVRGEANDNNLTDVTIGFSDGIVHLNWDNADASKVLKFNFDRNASLPINPIQIDPAEVNLSISRIYTDGGFSATIENNTTNKDGATNGTTGNAVFLYGRADAPDYRFSNNPGCGRVWYEFYDTNVSDPIATAIVGNLATIRSESPDANWYKNTLHAAATDGNITATTVAQITVSTTTGCLGTMTAGGYEKRGFTYDGSFGYPFRGTVQLDASDWLDVNGNNFAVEFYKAGNWVGETNKAKTSTDAEAEKISNRRIMW